MTNEEAADAARLLVLGFFNGDVETMHIWFKAPNPMFGGIPAQYLIDVGRAATLLRVIQDQLAENEPPPSKEKAP